MAESASDHTTATLAARLRAAVEASGYADLTEAEYDHLDRDELSFLDWDTLALLREAADAIDPFLGPIAWTSPDGLDNVARHRRQGLHRYDLSVTTTPDDYNTQPLYRLADPPTDAPYTVHDMEADGDMG
jgi:hypothetical protein